MAHLRHAERRRLRRPGAVTILTSDPEGLAALCGGRATIIDIRGCDRLVPSSARRVLEAAARPGVVPQAVANPGRPGDGRTLVEAGRPFSRSGHTSW